MKGRDEERKAKEPAEYDVEYLMQELVEVRN